MVFHLQSVKESCSMCNVSSRLVSFFLGVASVVTLEISIYIVFKGYLTGSSACPAMQRHSIVPQYKSILRTRYSKKKTVINKYTAIKRNAKDYDDIKIFIGVLFKIFFQTSNCRRWEARRRFERDLQ